MIPQPCTHGFADELLRQRRAAGLSQRELGFRAGLVSSYVSRLEMPPERESSRQPSRHSILALAEGLEATPADRDALLVTAGFMPLDRAHVFTDEPWLSSVIYLLQRDDLPDSMRTYINRSLGLLVAQTMYLPAAFAQERNNDDDTNN